MRGRPGAVQVCAALNEARARYLVIGGIACILHRHVRATTDVGILVERSRDNVERVLAALATLGYGYARDITADEILRKPITVMGDDPAVDIFLVAWSVKYDDAVRGSSVVEVDGVAIPVIGLDDLIATKRTGRLLDAADVEVLDEIREAKGVKRAK